MKKALGQKKQLKLMEITYCCQRCMINAVLSPSIADLKIQWPYALVPRFMYSHFKLLSEKSILKHLERLIQE